MRGRKPTPTFLKIMRGNPSKTPLNIHEPKPPGGIPTCPPHLSKYAKQIWDEAVADLAGMGLLHRCDRRTIEGFSVACDHARTANLNIQRRGIILKDGKKNPACAIYHQAVQEINTLGSALGFNPAARTRITTIPLGWTAEKTDDFDEFMKADATG